jgi:DNA-binding Lrp family transcriptional regulator
MKPDTKDLTLINALQQNASRRLEDLARDVKLASSSSVHERIRRLEQEGIIRGWTVKVDSGAIGLNVTAFIGVRSSKPCSELMGALQKLSAIEECHSVAGELSMMLKVRVTGTAELLELTDALRQIPGIEQTETTIVLKTQIERPVPAPITK